MGTKDIKQILDEYLKGTDFSEINNTISIQKAWEKTVGKPISKNTTIKSFNDHRIAMSFYIASHLTKSFNKNNIDSCYKKSFPEFLTIMERLYND